MLENFWGKNSTKITFRSCQDCQKNEIFGMEEICFWKLVIIIAVMTCLIKNNVQGISLVCNSMLKETSTTASNQKTWSNISHQQALFPFHHQHKLQHLKIEGWKVAQHSDQIIRQGQQASSEQNERRPVGPSEFSESASEMSERRRSNGSVTDFVNEFTIFNLSNKWLNAGGSRD